MGNMSAIYEFLGASPDEIPMLWLAAPMTGLIVQPIVGYLSDHTWSRTLGRRRPYFLVGAILSSAMLFIMPNSPTVWMAAGALWILDSSINISMEPFRAFVADKLDEKQRSFGFAMQSMFIGLASFIAGYLPQLLVKWFGVSRESAAGGSIPQNILLSFYIGGTVFFLAVLYTIITSKEYPPAEIDSALQEKETKKGFGAGAREIFSSIANMPGQMKRLALVNFLTWPGLFLMWFYYSTGVATQIFHGDASSNKTVYTQGLEHANTTSAILNLVTFLFAFSLPFWARSIGKKMTHSLSLILGGIGLISVYYIQDPAYLYISMGLVGIAWSSILSMPYSMLSGSIPANKMGIYMGIFNFFIVLPEIIASLFFGKIMSAFLDNNRLMAVQIGGFLLILAAIVCMMVIRENETAATS